MHEPIAQAPNGFNRLKRCRHGYMLFNVNDEYIGRSLDLYGEFSEGEVELFRKIVRPNDIVLDVGANIGAHTLFFAQSVAPMGGVIAFEPQRIIYQTLCANMALNSSINAFCMNAALGDKNGAIQVADLDPRTRANFGGVSIEGQSGVPVALSRIDDLPLGSCRLIKIDVEGMEASVLRGAQRVCQKFRPLLYVENDREDRSAELTALLRQMNYELYWHEPKLFNADNYFGNRENVFGDLVSVNMLCLPREADQSLATGLMRVTGA